jgi:hypothetical protein
VKKFRPGWPEFAGWGLTVISIYAALFGLGWLVMGRYWLGAAASAVAIATIFGIMQLIKRMDWEYGANA